MWLQWCQGRCLFDTTAKCVAIPPLQVYLLERLAAGDLTTGKLLLHAVVRAAVGA